MIQLLSVQHFKSIFDVHINLNNLTVLTGINGMGKSSLIQILLLLRQSWDEKTLPEKGLKLKGKYLDLGKTKDVFNATAPDDAIHFHIEWLEAKFIGTFSTIDKESDLLPREFSESNNTENQALFTTQFRYLSADRIVPKTTYSTSQYEISTLNSIGIHGEYAVHYLNVNASKEINIPAFCSESTANKTLGGLVDYWMSRMSSEIKVITRAYPELDQVGLTYSFGNGMEYTDEFKPQNVGFGLTYVLPVIIALLSSKPGDLLIIENPESHLHPKGQSVLAEMMAIAAENGVQLIIETHSDHIVNGIRVCVKKSRISPDNVSLYYFDLSEHDPNNACQIIEPVIDKDGRIDHWPKGFFDEWENSLDQLLAK